MRKSMSHTLPTDYIGNIKDVEDRLFNASCPLFKAEIFLLDSVSCRITHRTDIISPSLHLPSLVGPVLFRLQSGHVRSAYGFSDILINDPSPQNGPIYGRNGENGPELFFKLAVCSCASSDAVWCDRDDFLSNIVRASLSNERNVHGNSSSNRIYLDREYVSCHKQSTGALEKRYTNVSVVDVCNSDSASTASSTSDRTQGTNAILLLVPFSEVCEVSLTDTCSQEERGALGEALDQLTGEWSGVRWSRIIFFHDITVMLYFNYY